MSDTTFATLWSSGATGVLSQRLDSAVTNSTISSLIGLRAHGGTQSRPGDVLGVHFVGLFHGPSYNPHFSFRQALC